MRALTKPRSCATSTRSWRASARLRRPQARRRRRLRRRPPRSPMLTADTFLRSGKVRDLYALPDRRIVLVASDRISAFDVILPTEIPDKGRVLTGLSRFWFSRTESIIPNHLVGVAPEE